MHEETVGIVSAQMKHMDVQLQSLDEIVNTVRLQNGQYHDAHMQSLHTLGVNVKQSYTHIAEHLSRSDHRYNDFAEETRLELSRLDRNADGIAQDVNMPLTGLRNDISATVLSEYQPTGRTPPKMQYQVPSILSKTEPLNFLLVKETMSTSTIQHTPANPTQSPTSNRTTVFEDASEPAKFQGAANVDSSQRPHHVTSHNRQASLREIDTNIPTAQPQPQPSESLPPITGRASAPIPLAVSSGSPKESQRRATTAYPPLKRQHTGSQDFAASLGPGSKLPKKLQAEGRENIPPIQAGGRTLRPRVS